MAAKKTATSKQFPAKSGDLDGEVEQRSADGSDGTRFTKEFVILASAWDADGYEHTANKAGVTGEAIQRGLHPRGDVSFDGSEEQPDGLSLTLAYSVETVPASVDHTPEDTTTPRDVIEGEG